VAAGDGGEALRLLVDRYSGVLYGLGLRLLGDRGMAEELVQDTFVRLWRSAGRFDPERGSVRTFVYAIARNAAIDLRRRAASRPLGGPELEQAGTIADDDEEPFELLMLGLELRDAMRALSDKHREALELLYDEDLSQRQAAARLGVPLGTVKTRAHHALRALRAELERREVAV
jgi:RNA polymerase sigma-70 factor, ECF subfamily